MDDAKQITVRMPADIWTRVDAVARERGMTYNDTVVELVSRELERRERARLLEDMDALREEILRRRGPTTFDSTAFVRNLRDGVQDAGEARAERHE